MHLSALSNTSAVWWVTKWRGLTNYRIVTSTFVYCSPSMKPYRLMALLRQVLCTEVNAWRFVLENFCKIWRAAMKMFAQVTTFGGCTKIDTFKSRSQICEKRLLASSWVSATVRVWQLGLPLDGFSSSLIFYDFSYVCREIQVLINLLKPTGHVMHHQFNIQQLYALPTLYLCVLYLSENKQRLVPLTA